MKKPLRKLMILAVILLFAGGTAFYWHHRQNQSADAQRTASMAEVKSGTIEEMVTAQGTLEPKEYVDVGAQVSGQVKSLSVEIGDEVKVGDIIAEIDPEVLLTQVAANEARLKNLQAQKAQQEAETVSARQKLKRNQLLIKENAISKEVLEDAQTAVKVADAQVTALTAQIEEAVSTLEGDKASLSYTKIYAPMNGTVVVQSVREGQTVNASQTAPVIVQVANLDVMTVKAQVAEADIMKLKVGMETYFTTLGSGTRRWQGKVRQILPAPEVINDVVLYNVLVDVDNTDRQLMSGMSTQLFFVVGRAENVTVLPVAALIKPLSENSPEKGQAYQVRVLEQQGAVEKTVYIGLMDRSVAEVREGLALGDKVLLPLAQPADTKAKQGGGGRMMGGPRL